ncbi:MAG: toll/interleukin-1 receptor domain-containing protein [Lachnospiraceae bacterium]|nr:toll/interleukin-1 receptor domain-containing protein [Lachnospiraceae bacterium]
MSKKLTQTYPPYLGEKPYLFLCFSEKDTAAVIPLLAALYARGCRVWYDAEKRRDPMSSEIREVRAQEAALAVVYLTDDAENDPEFREQVRLCQASGHALISIDAGSEDCGRSMDYTDKVRHITHEGRFSISEAAHELIRTPGFSQDLLGEDPVITVSHRGKLSALFFSITAVLIILILLGGSCFGWFQSGQKDRVTIHDPIIEQAAREALGGAAFTKERLAGITRLRFLSMPGDNTELVLFSSLETVEIPQALAPAAESFMSAGYTVVIAGGSQ